MGIGAGISISVLLLYLIKLLFIVFVIGLVGRMVLIIKNNIFTPEDIEIFKGTFKINNSNNKKEINNVQYSEVVNE